MESVRLGSVRTHVSDDEALAYIQGSLSLFQSAEIESHARGCPSCFEALEWAATFFVQTAQLRQTPAGPPTEKRREPRFATSDLGVLRVLSPLSLDQEAVHVLNTSRNGLGIRLRSEIEPGCLVQIRLKQTLVLGEVRYCSATPEGQFLAGIRIEDVTSLSSAK